MTIDEALEALDRAGDSAGIALIPVPGARLALFGPHVAGPGFTLVMAPADDGRMLAVRIRPVVAHAEDSHALLQETIDAWQLGHEWPRFRIAPVDVDGEVSLLVEGAVQLMDVDAMTADGLARALDDVAASSRDFWDTCPAVLPSLSEVAADLVRDLEAMLIESDG